MIRLSEIKKVFNGYIPIDIYENGRRIFADVVRNIPRELETCEVIDGDIINNRIDCEVTK